jgi:predicted nucleotidyltransferase
MSAPLYPTLQHDLAAQQIVEFFSCTDGVDAVLLVNSCARGRATRDSCLDIIVLVSPTLRDPGYGGTVLERAENKATDDLYRAWDADPQTQAVHLALRNAGRFAEIHLDLIDGTIMPKALNRDDGLDDFEIAIGNYFVYSRPLWVSSNRFDELKACRLPYYDGRLRADRLSATREFCLYALDHIEPYVERGLYFQAFDRLYHALQGFLQGLFIARRRYPIAYNKWIREQVENILILPELYRQLPGIIEIHALESHELVAKAQRLRALCAAYLIE